jgi:hypothetical protein
MFEFWTHGNGFIDVRGTFFDPCRVVSCGIITVQSNERCKTMENCCYQDEQHNHHLWVWSATLRDTPPPRALMNSN